VNPIRLSASAMLLLACGNMKESPICRSACGLELVNSTNAKMDCAAIQAIEDSALDTFPKANDGRFRYLCPALTGVQVHMRPEHDWHSEGSGPIVGLTKCEDGAIHINNAPPENSPLLHEMAHLAQGCNLNACTHGGVDPAHYCWEENSIYKAIHDANTAAIDRIYAGNP
jgi:hypothetical protein